MLKRYRAALFVAVAGALAAPGCHKVDEIAAPQVTLPGVEVRSYSGGEADLTLGFAVGNPNSFDLTLIEIDGTLFLNKREIGPVAWQGERDCKKQGAVQVRIPAHVVLSQAGVDSLLAAMVDGRDVMQAVRGEVTFARGVIRRTFPLATDGRRDEAR
jgi:hypothetical protein